MLYAEFYGNFFYLIVVFTYFGPSTNFKSLMIDLFLFHIMIRAYFWSSAALQSFFWKAWA